MLGLIGSHWGTAAAVLVGRLLLSWISYRAAIREGAEASPYFHAAFDFYRHEILEQMALDITQDAQTERALWQRLTADVLQRIVPVPGVVAATGGSAPAAKGKMRRSAPPA